ncbi:MAG: hypothetical protein MZU95_02860 [Desulfomicrobium escambiense]|nr:hypothetical protein [Desulfomicrobium escambiense]
MQSDLDRRFKATGHTQRLLPALHPAELPRRRKRSTSRVSRPSSRW